MQFLLHNPTKLYFGKDKIFALKDEVEKGTKVLLTYGSGSIKKYGLYDKIVNILKELGCEIFELKNIMPNPKLSSVREGIEICKSNRVQYIIAVGGGSVIDASKAISIGAANEHDIWDMIMKKKIPEKNIPVGTILTLSATGTEMNPNSVITNEATNEKVGFSFPLTFPVFSILDPTYTKTVCKKQTANGIVDTISHLFEQYFNDETNTELLDRFCESSISYMMSIGIKLLDNLEDYSLRESMMYTSMIALNLSLSVAGGDWATHSIEHAVSGVYDISHGEGLAIIMPSWINFVSKTRPEKVIKFGKRVLGLEIENRETKEICDEVSQVMKTFFKMLGLPTSLRECNIDETNIDKMVELSFVKSKNYIGSYVKLDRDAVRVILKESMRNENENKEYNYDFDTSSNFSWMQWRQRKSK